jgi:hypothetical protein
LKTGISGGKGKERSTTGGWIAWSSKKKKKERGKKEQRQSRMRGKSYTKSSQNLILSGNTRSGPGIGFTKESCAEGHPGVYM